jgi:hypothetical protein
MEASDHCFLVLGAYKILDSSSIREEMDLIISAQQGNQIWQFGGN